MKTLASHSIWILLVVLVFTSTAFSQTYEKRWAVSVGGSALQYVAPSGTQALQGAVWSGAVQLSADRYLAGAFDFRTKIMYAPQVLFPVSESFTRASLWDIQYQMVFKFNNGLFFKENGFFGPFISTGLGGSYTLNRPDAYVPVSAGLRLRVNDHMAFRLESTRKYSLNQDYQPVVHALAFVYNIETKEVSDDPRTPDPIKEQMVAQVPLPNDRDSDGLLDWEDDCPQQAGYIHYNGCPSQPDLVGELVADNGSKVRTLAPAVALNPNVQPDTPDVQANNMGELTTTQIVPSAPGLFKRITYGQNEPFENTSIEMLTKAQPAKPVSASESEWADENAIPVAAAWGKEKESAITVDPTRSSPFAQDPVQVKEEVLLASAAPADGGFPVAMIYPESGPCGRPGQKQAAGYLVFETGKESLPSNTPQVLAEIADRMKSCDQMKLIISGHADQGGNQRDNLVLSIMRAYNVKYYLVYHHGISQSRITSSGFGNKAVTQANPAPQGSEGSRRVDFELQF